MKQLNPTTKIIRTKYCEVPVDDLFSHESFNSISKNKEELESLGHEDHDYHVHPDEDIQFLIFEFENVAFEHKKLDENIATLLWEKPHDMNVIRCKGLVNIHGSDHKHSLQGYFMKYIILRL